MAHSQFVELPVITLFRLPPFFFDWCLISQLFVHVSHACRLWFVCCVLFTVHVLDNSKLLHLALICTECGCVCLHNTHLPQEIQFEYRRDAWKKGSWTVESFFLSSPVLFRHVKMSSVKNVYWVTEHLWMTVLFFLV